MKSYQDVISRYCRACNKEIENFSPSKRFCRAHDVQWQLKPPPKLKNFSGRLTIEISPILVEKLDVIIEGLGFRTRSDYIRELLNREIKIHEEL